MGQEPKRSLSDAIKAKIDSARVEAARAGGIGFEKLKDGGATAASAAAKAGKVGFEALKDSSSAVAAGAISAKHTLDEKTRASLEKAKDASKKVARKNLERLRKAHPDATPAEILDLLEEDLKSAEKTAEGGTGEFVSAAAIFIFSAFEIHGDKVESPEAAQKLIDAVAIADHDVTKNVVKYGGAAIAIAAATSKRLGPIGKMATAVAGLGATAGAKFALIASITSLARIKNPGKKSVTWVVSAATRKILGEPPLTWSSEESEN
ncbi:MAG: hypothetical protein RL196_110 [Actinomycetota bacterium]|jgi:hypothetical protein